MSAAIGHELRRIISEVRVTGRAKDATARCSRPPRAYSRCGGAFSTVLYAAERHIFLVGTEMRLIPAVPHP